MTSTVTLPGILGEILTEVEKLDDIAKQKLLISLRRNAILKKSKSIDQRITPTKLTDEELMKLVRETRKESSK